MSQNLKTKTNEELIKLISDAAAELEWRRQANAAVAKDGDVDEGGDRPPNPPHFP